MALPVGLLGLRQLVRGQHLGGRGWVRAGAGHRPQPPLGGPTRPPRAPGSAHSPAQSSPGLGARPPEAQGGRRPSPLPLRGGHPQGWRQGTHQVEILLCVQVFHCERETHTINKQDPGAGGERVSKGETEAKSWRKKPREMGRAKQTCGEKTEMHRKTAESESSRDTHRRLRQTEALRQKDVHKGTGEAGRAAPHEGPLPPSPDLTSCWNGPQSPQEPRTPGPPSMGQLKAGMRV